jgi:hypothetical protein
VKEKAVVTNKAVVVCERCGRRLTAGMARLGNLGNEAKPVPAVVCRDAVRCGALVSIRLGTVEGLEVKVYELDPALKDASSEFDVFWAEAKAAAILERFEGVTVVTRRYWSESGPGVKIRKVILASRDPLGFERQLLDVGASGVEMLMQIDRVLGGTFIGVVAEEASYMAATDAFFAEVAQEIVVPG